MSLGDHDDDATIKAYDQNHVESNMREERLSLACDYDENEDHAHDGDNDDDHGV